MDIAILAGGYGTRLKGIWDRPKCLIPFQGRPLIEYLVDKAFELKPRKIFLLLGHKASEVVAWREGCCPHRNLVPIIETWPSGTASAIRNAFPFLYTPLLILNGDTVLEYSLEKIVKKFVFSPIDRITVSWVKDKYAGASLFSLTGISKIICSKDTDLNVFVNDESNLRVPVPGFLDVGTPEGFRKSQQLLTWPKDYDCMERT